MKENENEALFELVREVPTELSKEQVMQIIATVPTLPPPSGNTWFNHINLNSIIMTTTTVAIIASAVIYFSNPKAEQPNLGQEQVAPVEIESPAPASNTMASDDSIDTISPMPEQSSTALQVNESPEPTSQEYVQEAPAEPNEPVQAATETTDAVPVPDSIRPAESTPGTTTASGSQLPPTASKAAAAAPALTPTAPTLLVDNSAEAPKEVKGMDDLRLMRLKRTLLRELTRDRLIKSKRSMNVLHFKEGEIFVNNWRLNYEEFTKYSELLFKFRIEPGPEKRVVTDPKFIMVGNFTEEGFKGSMHGRAADLKFVNDAVILNGVFDPDHRGDKVQIVRFPESPRETAEPGDLFIKTEGKVSDAEVNISLLDRIMSSDSGESLLDEYSPEVQTFNNATTVFEKGKEDNTIDMNTRQIRSFKKELYKSLHADGQIQSKSDPVVMFIYQSSFKVNDNVPMEGRLLGRYQRLMARYGLKPAPNRRVMMNKGFIMIGDFEDGRFKGTIQGKLAQDQLQGTFLEEELQKYKIFGLGNSTTKNYNLREDRRLNDVQLKRLKHALYSALLEDDQIKDLESNVVILLEKEPFQVNLNFPMTEDMSQRYSELLEKYSITPGKNHKIIMNSDFILAGEFSKHAFHGAVHGEIKRNRVDPWILEKHMPSGMGYSFKNLGSGISDALSETVSETRKVMPFSRLQVSGLAVVYLHQGAHKDIEVEASGIELKDIKTESEDGILRIYTTVGEVHGESISIHVTSPEVNTIWVDGAAELFSEGVYKTGNLKLISQDAGSIEMAVDAHRLHLQMDGGDIHLEGKAKMEKVEFLPDGHFGTLDQSGLNVLERWTHEGAQSWGENNVPALRRALLSKLIEQGYISTINNPASIRFFSDGMTVNDHEVAPNYVEEYRAIYRKFGLPDNRHNRLWIDPDFMILAKKEGKFFELEIIGTDLELNVENSWRKLEENILDR